MQKLIKAMAVGSLATLLFGCDGDIKIVDGRIPQEYLSFAQAFVGDYHGFMERHPGTLTLRLDGDRPVLTSTVDLAGDGCESSVGALQELSYGKDDKIWLKKAKFLFRPGKCSDVIEGRAVYIDMDFMEHKDTMELEILDHREWRWVSRPVCEVTSPGGTSCRPGMELVQFAIYRTGEFSRNR